MLHDIIFCGEALSEQIPQRANEKVEHSGMQVFVHLMVDFTKVMLVLDFGGFLNFCSGDFTIQI